MTADRYFSRQSLTEKLFQEYKMTYIGTMQNKLREIPPVFLESQVFFFRKLFFKVCFWRHWLTNNNGRLSSYKNKKCYHNFNLAPWHGNLWFWRNRVSYMTTTERRAESTWSTKRFTTRWAIVHFQNLLDITVINVSTIFSIFHPNWHASAKHQHRLHTIPQLAKELVVEHTVRRFVNLVDLHRNVVYLMTQFTDNLPPIGEQASSTTNCYIKWSPTLCWMQKKQKICLKVKSSKRIVRKVSLSSLR